MIFWIYKGPGKSAMQFLVRNDAVHDVLKRSKNRYGVFLTDGDEVLPCARDSLILGESDYLSVRVDLTPFNFFSPSFLGVLLCLSASFFASPFSALRLS